MGEGVARTLLPLPAVVHGIKEHDGWRPRNTIVGGGIRDLRWDMTKSRASEPYCGCFGSRRQLREEQILGSAQVCQGGSSGSACQPGHCQAEAVTKVERLQKAYWMHWAVLVDWRSTPSRELSRRLRRSHENDPLQNSSRSSSIVRPSTSQSQRWSARLTRLEAQAAPVGDTVVAEGAQVLTLQQMVNQLKGERDSLSQELCRSRAVKARPWCGEGPPDVSVIPPIPDHLQDLEEWMNGRNPPTPTRSRAILEAALRHGVTGCVTFRYLQKHRQVRDDRMSSRHRHHTCK